MPQGDKSKYTGKQARKANHIADGYRKRGATRKEAERRAWATVNKQDGGGKKPGGSGHGARPRSTAARRAGRRGTLSSPSRTGAR